MPKPKRIVFPVTNDLNYDQRMQRICSSLSANGFDVYLVGRSLTNSKPLTEFSFKTYRMSCWSSKGKLFYLEYNIRLFFHLLFQSFDILCAVDLDTMPASICIKLLRGKTLGYDAHEYFSEVPEVVNRKFTKKVWELVALIAIPLTDFRYTVSTTLAECMTQRYKKTFKVIRNLPFYLSIHKMPTSDPYILYQGALNEGRGLEQLIRAMAQIPLKLKLAGEGDLSNELKQLAHNLKLEDKVKFLGYLKPDDLRQITANAFIGYNLLENKGLSYYYSLANKFFDYTLYGVPSLIPPFPEYEALNKEFKIGIISSLDVTSIVDSILLLVNNELLYKELSENCLEAAKQLNWELEERKLLEIYSRFAGN